MMLLKEKLKSIKTNASKEVDEVKEKHAQEMNEMKENYEKQYFAITNQCRHYNFI